MTIPLLDAVPRDGGASHHLAATAVTNVTNVIAAATGNENITFAWLDHVPDNVNESPTALYLVDRIHVIFVPLIILGGTVGNMLSLAVFRNTKLRRLSTSCYLTALSLSDTGFLLTLLTLWLEVNSVPAYNQPVLCPLITYVSQVCSFLSPWLVVAFTVERFVATCYPLRRASICTISRARVVVTGLTVFASMLYSYALVMAGHQGEPGELAPPEGFDEYGLEWGYEPERDANGTIVGGATVRDSWNASKYKCGVKPAYMGAMNVLNWVDTVVTLIFPLVIIIVLNMLIARAVLRFERVRRRMTSTSSAGNNGCALPASSGASRGGGGVGGGDGDNNSACSSQDGNGRLYGSNASVTAASRLQQVPSTDTSSYSRRGVNFQHRSGSPGGGGSATPTGLRKGNCHQRSVRGRYQIKITKMLLMISSVFLALNSPSYVARLWGFICSHSCTQAALFYNVQQWSQLAFYLNFAVNFLLYCASGQNFRKSLRHLVCKALSKAGHGGRHFSRKNTGNTTLSTTAVTTIHNNGATAGGVSAISAYQQLPLSTTSSTSVKSGQGGGRQEVRLNKAQTDTV